MPPTCVPYFEPLDLDTALVTVHKDSSQNRASPGKVALGEGIQNYSCAHASDLHAETTQ